MVRFPPSVSTTDRDRTAGKRVVAAVDVKLHALDAVGRDRDVLRALRVEAWIGGRRIVHPRLACRSGCVGSPVGGRGVPDGIVGRAAPVEVVGAGIEGGDEGERRKRRGQTIAIGNQGIFHCRSLICHANEPTLGPTGYANYSTRIRA